MSFVPQWIVPFAVVLGLLIFVHELGHFLMAKRAGVGVLKFSLGFGPKLIGFKRGETEYQISALPLGGYVKMIGEDPGDSSPEAVDPRRSFSQKGVGTRALIILAGPLTNLILPVLLFSGIYMTVGQDYVVPLVGRPDAGSPAAEAGLEPGDRILAVDGKPVSRWEQLELPIRMSNGEPVALTVQRAGKTFEVRLTPRKSKLFDPLGQEHEVWDVGLHPLVPTRVTRVQPGSPARAAGLEAGDEIVAVDGTPVAEWDELSRLIRARPGLPTLLTVVRDGKRFQVQVTPARQEERDANGQVQEIGIIGVLRGEPAVQRERLNPVRAVWAGVEETVSTSATLIQGVWRIIEGRISARTIGGPVMIAQVTGEVAQRGLKNLINWTALLSINLAILNLLPIPILDGGHLLFSLIEWLRGKPVSLRKREIAQQVGFVLLVGLMIFAFYNDIFRLLGRP
jgi:regulator of sigma E protease